MARPRGTWRQRLSHARKEKRKADLRLAEMSERVIVLRMQNEAQEDVLRGLLKHFRAEGRLLFHDQPRDYWRGRIEDVLPIDEEESVA